MSIFSRDVGKDRLDIEWRDAEVVYRPPVQSRQAFLSTVTPERSLPSARVFIASEACREMVYESSVDTSREHGGILLGEAFQDLDQTYYAVIRRAVCAVNTEGSAVHLHFRPGSWKSIWDHLAKCPTLNVVGWYHT